MLFLRHPAAAVDTLLEAHAAYMASPDHAAETQRAKRPRDTDDEAIAEKSRQVQLKLQAARLRGQRRQMIALKRKISAGEMAAPPWRQAKLYHMWQSGELEHNLDEIIAQHGYGQTSSDYFEAPRVKHYVTKHWTR